MENVSKQQDIIMLQFIKSFSTELTPFVTDCAYLVLVPYTYIVMEKKHNHTPFIHIQHFLSIKL